MRLSFRPLYKVISLTLHVHCAPFRTNRMPFATVGKQNPLTLSELIKPFKNGVFEAVTFRVGKYRNVAASESELCKFFSEAYSCLTKRSSAIRSYFVPGMP